MVYVLSLSPDPATTMESPPVKPSAIQLPSVRSMVSGAETLCWKFSAAWSRFRVALLERTPRSTFTPGAIGSSSVSSWLSSSVRTSPLAEISSMVYVPSFEVDPVRVMLSPTAKPSSIQLPLSRWMVSPPALS